MTLPLATKVARLLSKREKLVDQIHRTYKQIRILDSELNYLDDLQQIEVSESHEPVLGGPDQLRRDGTAAPRPVPEVAKPSPVSPPKPSRDTPPSGGAPPVVKKPARDTPPCSSCGDLKTFVGTKTLGNGKKARMLICEECSNEQIV